MFIVTILIMEKNVRNKLLYNCCQNYNVVFDIMMTLILPSIHENYFFWRTPSTFRYPAFSEGRERQLPSRTIGREMKRVSRVTTISICVDSMILVDIESEVAEWRLMRICTPLLRITSVADGKMESGRRTFIGYIEDITCLTYSALSTVSSSWIWRGEW